MSYNTPDPSTAQGTIPPASVFLLWPKPNYVNPESRAGLLIGFEVTLTIVAAIVVALRIYTRKFITKSIGIDDWLMVVSCFFAIVLLGINLASLHYGWGRHIWDFQFEWFVPARKLEYVTEIFFVPPVVLTKISVLIFYLRIFPGKTFRILVWIGMFYTIGWFFSSLFGAMFQCLPVNSIWNIHVEGHCFDSFSAFTSSSVGNTMSDIYIFTIPIPLVWRMRLPRRQRIGLVGIFMLGLIVCIAGGARIYYIVKLFGKTDYDFTWNGVPLVVLTEVEILLGILGPSLPALKPLVVQYFPTLLGSSRGTAGSSIQFSEQRLQISSRGGDSSDAHAHDPPMRMDNYTVETLDQGKPDKHLHMWNVDAESNV